MSSSRLTSLRNKYQQSLPAKLDQLNKFFEEYQTHDSSSAATESNLYEFVHNLAGSSGMYGYDELADAARRFMNSIEQQEVSVFQEQFERLHHMLVLLAWGHTSE